jgi:hypothetical protein
LIVLERTICSINLSIYWLDNLLFCCLFLYISWISPLLDKQLAKIFSFCRLSLLWYLFPLLSRNFPIWYNPNLSVHFTIISWAVGILFRKSLPVLRSWIHTFVSYWHLKFFWLGEALPYIRSKACEANSNWWTKWVYIYTTPVCHSSSLNASLIFCSKNPPTQRSNNITRRTFKVFGFCANTFLEALVNWWSWVIEKIKKYTLSYVL